MPHRRSRCSHATLAHDAARRVTLPPHGSDFLASVRAERGLARNTAAAYRIDLEQYQATVSECGGEHDEDAVRTHMGTLRDLGLADASIARKFASIRAYHRFLVLEGLSDLDPTATLSPPARPRSLPKALTVDEVTAILDAIDLAAPTGRRDRAIVEVLYGTGCRVSELIGVDLHDLDLETRTLLLTGKGSKQRIVPVGRFAIDAITEWLDDRMTIRTTGRDPGALFLSTRGHRLTRQAVWRVVKGAATEAGLDADRVSPHVFRHSAATHMVEGGADLRTVQELLGHASLSTTQIYTKVTADHLREVLASSHPRA